MEAILDLLVQGNDSIIYSDIIDYMIASVWYTVYEYHLHLGPRDGTGKVNNSLERAINKLSKVTSISNDAPIEDSLDVIKENDKIIRDEKMQISKMVPYRLISSFLEKIGGNDKIRGQQENILNISPVNMGQRKLKHVRDLWLTILENISVNDIYSGILK